MAGAALQPPPGQPAAGCHAFQRRHVAGEHRHRRPGGLELELGGAALLAGDPAQLVAQHLAGGGEGGRVGAPGLDHEARQAGHLVGGSRLQLDRADVGDRPLLDALDQLPEAGREARRRPAGIAPVVEGSGPGVVGLAADHGAVAVDADDGVDDTQVKALRLQPRTLLDVELEVAGHGVDRRGREEVLAALEAVAADALLVVEADGRDPSGRRVTGFPKRPADLDRRDHAVGAVEATACRHGVAVGAEQQPGPGAGRVAEDVVDLVEIRLQAGRAHPFGQPAARLQVGRGSGDPVDAAVGTAADLRQLGQVAEQPVSRDARGHTAFSPQSGPSQPCRPPGPGRRRRGLDSQSSAPGP